MKRVAIGLVARGVADANVPGDFKWINVPACQPGDKTTCALNINSLQDARDASVAAGSLIERESTVPWMAWTEGDLASSASQLVIGALQVRAAQP